MESEGVTVTYGMQCKNATVTPPQALEALDLRLHKLLGKLGGGGKSRGGGLA